jgi:hypothetical protein
MNCDELKTFINTTLAEDRTPGQMENIYAHTRNCPQCNAFLSEMAHLEKLLGSILSIPANASLVRNVMERIRHEEPAPAVSTGEFRKDLSWSLVLLLSFCLSGLVYCALINRGGAESLQSLWTFRLYFGGTIVNWLRQPFLISLIFGLGAVLAAIVLLWERESSHLLWTGKPNDTV